MQSTTRAVEIMGMVSLLNRENMFESENVQTVELDFSNQAGDKERAEAGLEIQTQNTNSQGSNIYEAFNESGNPSKMTIRKVHPSTYYVSPINSGESDVDDSDRDPHFEASTSSSSSSDISDENEVDTQITNFDTVDDGISIINTESIINDDDKNNHKSLQNNTWNEDKENQENETNMQVNEENRQIVPADIENISNPKRGRKRQRKPENWITKKTTLLRNSGKPYTSLSKSKKQIPQRKMRPPCTDKCRLRCATKIDEEKRTRIFNNYWALGDLQRQREFIISHTDEIKPKYRYSSTQNLRKLNTAFYFTIDGTRCRVCKLFFKATLDLNDRPIRTALIKKGNDGFLEVDKRGKHGQQPTVNPEIKDSIRTFINSIPRIESHYLRAQTSREFIDSSKSLADLYRDYKESREQQNKSVAMVSMFNRIFRNEFNISFFIPKKDQCDLCEAFKNSDEENKKTLRPKYDQHQKEKEWSRTEKEADKNDKIKPHVIVYDLQAVMPVPRGNASSFYYKSKLNCINLTICDLHLENVDCYFWDETHGKRGAVEIGSCIFRYLPSLNTKESGNKLDLIIYSDNCCGQQKNKYTLAAYAYAVEKLQNLNSITHKFLICGHTQNEGDNVHSVIEKQVTRYLKSSPIYTPQQYTTLIRSAKKMVCLIKYTN